MDAAESIPFADGQTVYRLVESRTLQGKVMQHGRVVVLDGNAQVAHMDEQLCWYRMTDLDVEDWFPTPAAAVEAAKALVRQEADQRLAELDALLAPSA